jgi:transposase
MADWEAKRRTACERVRNGESIRKVARDIGVSVAFVSKWANRGVTEEEFHDRPRSGRPRVVPERLVPVEKRLLKQLKGGSSANVAKTLRMDYGIQITSRAVRIHAHELGLKSRVRPTKPRLYKNDFKRRLSFAHKRRGRGFWERVWWSDEKAFVLHNEPRRQWVETMDEVEPRGKALVEPSVRVWAAVSESGWTKIHQIESSWTSDEYVEFLKTKGLPSIREISGDNFVFQQDGDGAHKAKKVQKFFEENAIETLPDFPPRSPDLSPIENEWANLVHRLQNAKITTIRGLWTIIQREWRKLSQEREVKMARDVRKRLKQVIALEGKITKY